MGRELYDGNTAARAVFDMAEQIRPGTIEQIFNGTLEELTKTVNTQPAMFCVELAAAEALAAAGIMPASLAGFSLGEIAALAFSGAVGREDGFRLVIKRAELMQKASESSDAAMAAVLKLEDDSVEEICRGFDSVYPVNYNCPGQVSVAGPASELAAFGQKVKEAGGRFMPLKVSGAFHSPFMREASEGFKAALTGYDIKAPGMPLYSNMTALPYEGDPAPLLAGQICSPVLWRRTVENMIAGGTDTFIETGPGKTLSGLITRISDKVRVHTADEYL